MHMLGPDRPPDLARVLLCCLILTTFPSANAQNTGKAYAIVHPHTAHSKLQIDLDGLAALRSLDGPVAPVVVIGPYRSGKSFLLNQLLQVTCGAYDVHFATATSHKDGVVKEAISTSRHNWLSLVYHLKDQGFEVGHSRSTETKGMWFWNQPAVMQAAADGGLPLSLIFVDTEGFESTGKADAYDDRIFALSALISSLLIYNLPETIRESDLEKLSFATELAEALFTNPDSTQGRRGGGAFDSANMLWVIQRDFLQGKTPQQMLQEALRPVDNPSNDKGIAQVNRVRASLQRLAVNSTAVGLKQPHLERTRLCELPDEELDPTYVQQRDALRLLVRSMAKPKVVAGTVQTGADLAALVEKVVEALNSRDMPTGSSLIEYFNKELVQRCTTLYREQLEQLPLPCEDGRLEAKHLEALQAAQVMFAKDRFGNANSPEIGRLRDELHAKIEREFSNRRNANVFESSRICEKLEMACEDEIESQQHVALPSVQRFRSKTQKCRERFEARCVGPALALQQERLQRLWTRELEHFQRDYNDKLYNGLNVIALLDIMAFRFIIRQSLMETMGWLLFVFLQIYPKLYLSGGSMYESTWWQRLAKVWEVCVYNPLFDLMTVGPLLLLAAVLFAVYRCMQRFPRLCPAWLKLPGRRGSRKQVQQGTSVKDLDV